MMRHPIVVIGVGNPMRTDDGIGPLVIDLLDESRRHSGAVTYDAVQLDGEPTRVIDAWNGRRLAIVCDAVVRGSEPGTVHEATIADLDRANPAPSTASSHAAGVTEALALGRALDRMPHRMVVVGIEPASVEFGQGLTAAVEASIGVVVDRIEALIKEAKTEGTKHEC